MQEFPHHYRVQASAGPDGDVSLTSAEVETIISAPPQEFGGPGGQWSPETLLAAAVADCFVLSFRAIARASKLQWESLQCNVTGTLERKDGTARFTEFVIQATLAVPRDTNEDRAHRILEKAETSCLITNSLSSTTRLHAEVLQAS